MYGYRFTVLCLVGMGLTGCGSSKPEPGVVAENWTLNTEQLGIKAIYPPRSNVEVGDLFIARAAKAGEKLSTGDYVLASTKFDYIDIDAQIVESARKHTFTSLATYDDGSGNGSVQARALIPMEIDGTQVNSLVAFPGFTFASLAESDIGVNVTSSAIASALGFGRRSQYSVSYSVPSAETYGARYLLARKRFDEETSTRYTEDDLRRMREAADQLQATQMKTANAAAPILVFVTDVYLARALDVVVTSDEGMSGTFKAVTLAMVDLSDKKKSLEAQLGKLTGEAATKPQAPAEAPKPKPEDPKPKPEDPKPAAAAEKPKDDKPPKEGSTPPKPPAKQAEIDRVKSELAQVNDQLRDKVSQIVPDLPGVTGSVVRSSALGITLRQAFAEPVAIGYRGIHFKIAALKPSGAAGKPLEPDPGGDPGPLMLPGIKIMGTDR
ncbi:MULTISPECIES: hypothetical protein [unclassified Pseudomonas]|uniref:hypothetical protein n=1 Tax=unclassified Pseudomonas TaxID=196821 RepID=UPI00111C58F0|nr:MULTISPECIES: hypothetical protein [unclassified Pseudomonas]